MKFGSVGINHHITPIEIREKATFQDSDIIEATDALISDTLTEIVILSTCNRSEIYFMSADDAIVENLERVRNFFLKYFDIDGLEKYLYLKRGREAIRHLFAVTVGLDSLVIGEDQILGQVTDAHLTAMEMGVAKKHINKIFREAVTFSKRIKTESPIAHQPTSIAYVGVKLIEQEMGSLNDTKALIIGLGDMGKLALQHLNELHADITICNRTYANSEKIKELYPNVKILPYEERIQGITESDILISATASPHTIINASDISKRDKELYIMDLSLPRDVDPLVGNKEHIELFDIDHLEQIVRKNVSEREEILASYDEEMNEIIDDTLHWITATRVDPIMKSLNNRSDQIAQETLDYIFRKTDLNHSQKLKVDKIVRSALKKVAREPILQLKEYPQTEEVLSAIEILEEVYLS